MAEELILFDEFECYAVLTFNRPEKLNALSTPMVLQLQERLDDCRGRHAVVVITARGKAFFAGVDLRERNEWVRKGARIRGDNVRNRWYDTMGKLNGGKQDQNRRIAAALRRRKAAMKTGNAVPGERTPTQPYGMRGPGRSHTATLVMSAVIAIALSLAAVGAAAQQKYPSKPIRVVTPFAPGGGTDILARLLGPSVSEALGQTIVVDNRPGGGGTLGAGVVVRAEPDGYTLILVSGSYGANAALHDLPYDSMKDITPIILIGETGLVVSMFPKSPIMSIKDLIAYARANPGKLLFGSAGVGGLGHLAQELFRLQTKVDITHVPYKGTGPVMTALLTGEVHSSFSSIVPSIPHIKAGRLRAIGVTPARRVPALSEVPCISETLPGYEVIHWYGIWGPKGMHRDIVLRLNAEFAKVLRTDAMKTWFAGEGMEVAGGPPEQFLKRIASDVEKWKKVVKEANIKVAG